MPEEISETWWRDFFESTDSLQLSFFPGDRETNSQVRGLVKLLKLTKDDAIADICCGYCRHLARLVKRGYNVTGLDASSMMLDCACGLLESANADADLVRGDAMQLPFADGSFDVVLNLFNSFGYFLDEGQNVKVLSEAARVLKPGGRLFLDTRNKQFQILYAPYCQPTTAPDGTELILRCRYDRENKRMESRWSLAENPETLVHAASIRLYNLEELRGLIADAGFEEMGVYGTYNGQSFAGHHRQLLYVARKKG